MVPTDSPVIWQTTSGSHDAFLQYIWPLILLLSSPWRSFLFHAGHISTWQHRNTSHSENKTDSWTCLDVILTCSVHTLPWISPCQLWWWREWVWGSACGGVRRRRRRSSSQTDWVYRVEEKESWWKTEESVRKICYIVGQCKDFKIDLARIALN